ncbi:MAG TPA: chemotaxis protein CheB [Vicinamibacterales bacterium]|nr:chemotaxis protein CheB [Vicinamibacterales bacterium]
MHGSEEMVGPASVVTETSGGAPRFVVGIGASAGGLDPLVRFFDNLPKATGMAFVIVQHLSPDFKSLMDELLARHTLLPIHLVEDGMRVEADHVYLIPAKKEMIISGGRLLLSERDRQQELTLPIDMFFRSLAQDRGSEAVAIVFSGGGSDGSRGVRHVREAGGLVIAQDLESAQFDGMPRSTIDTGVVHHTLPPEDMPRVLLDHARQHSAAVPEVPEQEPPPPRGVDGLYRVLETEFGIDFNHYKPSTVTRRIERRLALAHSQNIDEYLARLRSERDELDALYRDLLIGVTRFFRDPDAFDLLEQRILPDLLTREPRTTPVRLWVAGCATGEEAYSLAIVLQDLMAIHGERPVKIFATDVHRGSLERAAIAAYEEDAVSNVSPERLSRYFIQSGNTYQVVPELRQMIVFAQHNVISDAPFTRLDLVTCRNLLIYLQPSVQQRILSLFHFALTQGGVLVLGPSETLGPVADGFDIVDKHWQVYRKAGEVRTPVDIRKRPTMSMDSRSVVPVLPAARHSLGQLLSVYDALLEETMPPSLIVSDRGELVHVLGGAARFLRVRDGRQSLDVQDLVEADLKMILAGGIKRALAERAPVIFNGVRAHADDEIYRVTIRPIAARSTSMRHLVVSFESYEPMARPAPAAPIQIDVEHVSQQQLAALEAELGTTKESLQAAIEQHEAANEELQASNEELQSANEELQSTNEELQSVNEELYTVNAEYQKKIAELTEVTNDLDNLLASTEIGTIFLDGQLRIRKFTPQVAETFGLLPHDIGRSIETFAHKMHYPDLVTDLRRVVTTARPIERDLFDPHGKSFFLRLLPYRAKGVADGVVLTLIDVSGLKAAEDALFHERYLLNSLLRSVPDAIYFKDVRGRFIRFNHAMATRLGVANPADAIGKTAFDLTDQQTAMALHREDEAVLRSGDPLHYRLEARTTADGSEAWDMVSRLPLVDRDNAIVGVIAIFRDVTEQVRARVKIDEEVRRRDQFLAMLSHELRNPLGAVVTATSMLKSAAPESGVQQKTVSVLERQSRQMARLLDDLLEVSRVTQNKIELRRRVVDLRLIAAEAADAVRPHMEDKGVHFTVDLDPEPVWVHGDAARLQQIQMNLLNNSAKYTPRGGDVSLKVRREMSGAVIRVKDNGVGISRQMLDSIFDLFVQARHTLDRSNGGLGVGLTLVRALVEMHGGTVAAHSDGDGTGSEFTVRLPLSTLSEPARPQDPVSSSAVPAGITVLVVEDSADSREMLCAMLTQEGFACHGAADGLGALRLIDQVSPDVVLLDVGLPGIDGLEVARRIRANSRHAGVPLVALTGYGQTGDRAATSEAGFDHHLVKPVQPEELVTLLTSLVATGARNRTPGASVEAVAPETAASPDAGIA